MFWAPPLIAFKPGTQGQAYFLSSTMPRVRAIPRTLLRKGARTGGVRDYHWTAALVLKMLEEENELMGYMSRNDV